MTQHILNKGHLVEHLHMVAELLQDNVWSRGRRFILDENGVQVGWCALGAHEFVNENFQSEDPISLLEFRSVMIPVIGDRAISTWNDTADNKEEVIEGLLEAAQRVMEGT